MAKTAIILAGSGTPGSVAATPPGNVSILTIVVDTILDATGKRGVTIQFIPGTGTFTGVLVEIEEPDQSTYSGAVSDGTATTGSGMRSV